MLLGESFAPPAQRLQYDQRMDDLPWFLGHPWELSDYAIVRPWQGYDSQTGQGRYEFVRHVCAAKANRGHVYCCYDHKEKKHVAVKVVPKEFVEKAPDTRDPEQPLGDTGCLRYLTMLNGPAANIATWIDCGRNLKSYFFVSEFAEGGDMFQFLKSKPQVPEETLKRLIYQILEGVRFIHHYGIVHLDLSVENVLMRHNCPPSQNCAILIDFGHAQRLRPNPTAGPGESPYLPIPGGSRGKAMYRDPVMWTNTPYDGPKADIFSVGMSLFHLLTVPLSRNYMIERTNPFDTEAVKFRYLMTNGIEQFFQSFGSDFVSAVNRRMSPAGMDLLKHLIKLDPQERPTAEEALGHYWFNSVRAALAPPRPLPPLELPPAAAAAAAADSRCDSMAKERRPTAAKQAPTTMVRGSGSGSSAVAGC
ncbi:unnamed protein product [Vitrella brassicaformis CCMP3155]|uniref:Protein kinase domain-containing protein n=1 Tax=Vitrella brassicaformis (strain CCMP3155) TaxID=1169540 RepID=A0A0G4EIR7_VITBC|nr:unnamed protein product [Vitrella brassicaformis CCMP3155]|eukprot:CEL95893.1 unnamed protein product [Vitrella brassicaformis CCMP3155]